MSTPTEQNIKSMMNHITKKIAMSAIIYWIITIKGPKVLVSLSIISILIQIKLATAATRKSKCQVPFVI